MIRLCSGFPPDWPDGFRDRFLAAFETHWPASIELVADPLSQGGDLDRHQLIIPAVAASDMANGDLLAWLDPDVETTSAVPSYVIPQLIKDADLCFIGRQDGDSDLAFWAVRLSPAVRLFLAQLADGAASAPSAGEAWAQTRAAAGLAERDLTPGGSGEIWQHGPLGRYSRRVPRLA